MSDRARGLAIAAALALCLVAGSTPRIVGDGGEYLAQAMNFAAFNGPALGRRAILDIEPRIHAIEPALAEWDIEAATVPSSDRRRDFLHFWFYALLATPALWIVGALGLSPLHAFTLMNLVLLGAATWVLLPRLGRALTLLLIGSPVVWWIDKAHTEVFTLSFVAVALALARDRPGWALIAAGTASTQNLPVTIIFILIAGAEVWRSRGRALTDKPWLAAATTGGILVLLHPTYTYLRHGTPSLLLYATRQGFPTAAELFAGVADPAIGLVGNAPFFLAGLVVSVLVVGRQNIKALATPEIAIAVAAGIVFLYAAAQTSNTHHGATPSLTRYALWLIPLAVPFLAAARTHARAASHAVLVALAVVSSVVSAFAFHPNVPQHGREPTWMASWMWTSHPTWHNPLPEVFSETELEVEGTTVPAATGRCEKVLLARGDPADGTWPIPCYPAELRAQCGARESLCYANRRGNEYVFVRAPGREGPPVHDRLAAWPVAAEGHVRAVFDAWDWWNLTARPPVIATVRAGVDIQSAEFGTDAKFLIVMRRRGPSPVIRLRPTSSRLVGRLFDPITGARLAELSFAGSPGELWNIEMPAAHDLVILAMTSGELPE